MSTAQGRIKSDLIFQLISVGLIFITFSRICRGEYVNWDDNILITENSLLQLPFIEAVSNVVSHFYHGDYIPLPLLTYWMEVRLFGFNAIPQHIVNISIHCINFLLLFLILIRTGLTRSKIYLICFIFAFHPLQVETVSWLSERKGLLSTLFLFLAILFHQSAKIKHQLSYGFFYVLSLLCKFTGVLLPVLLVFSDWKFSSLRFRDALKKQVPFLLLGFLASLIRIYAYGSSVVRFNETALSPERLAQLPLLVTTALGSYLKLFFYPIGLSAIYPDYVLSSESIGLSIFFILIVAIGLCVVRRATPEGKREFLFFSLWSIFFLLPVLQIIPRINYINDRYMYLPIIGFAALFGEGIQQVFTYFQRQARALGCARSNGFQAKLSLGLLASGVVALPLLSYERTAVWLNSQNLWEDTIQRNPRNAIAHNNLAIVYQEQKKFAPAIAEYEKVLLLGRGNGTDNLAYNNLGTIYSASPQAEYFDLAKAERFLLEGIERSPSLSEGFYLRFNLALVYLRQGSVEKGREVLKKLAEDIRSNSSDQKYFLLLRKAEEIQQKLVPNR